MRDQFGRDITYLRISVTDKCNLRCKYCMPAEGVAQKKHCDLLSLEELAEVAQEAAALGVRKIRITGGEPLVRRGIVELVRELAAIPGIQDLAMTTNGLLLPQYAEELRKAGLQRVNLSLDTLDGEKYREITRIGKLEDALAGIEAALGCGFAPVKLNTVLIGGFNDEEIPALLELPRRYPVELRFIELMPIGDPVFPESAFLSCDAVLNAAPELRPLPFIGGTARLYELPGAPGRVGLIPALTNHFCAACNRIRLTSDGWIKPCLHAPEEIRVTGLHGEALRQTLRQAILGKPARRGALSATEHSKSERDMNRIGG